MPLSSSVSRAERLIAVVRMNLAGFTLLAARLEPIHTGYPGVKPLLYGYVCFAVLLFLLLKVSERLPAWWAAVTFAAEFALFLAFMKLTGGANSQFFFFFTFLLGLATVRWQWRGTLWTAAAAIAAYLLMAVHALWFARDPDFDVKTLIVRTWYLVVVALLLGYLGFRQHKLDHDALRERTEAAAMEERTRLSRDLHDGLLQSLTGIALQLQALHPLLESDPQAAAERLREIQLLITREQRDLRSLIERMKPAASGKSLGLRLEELCSWVQRLWGIGVKLETDGLTEDLPDSVAEDVNKVVREAMVNAARHAQASFLQVNVSRRGGEILVRIGDNGHGFSFRGEYDLATLEKMKAGPISLRERIASLGGNLVISSGESGSRLDIVLPVPRAGA